MKIHRKRKQLLEKVIDLPIIAQEVTISINAVVSEATDYNLLVKNNWLMKYKTNLN